jgi:hypothetical protein
MSLTVLSRASTLSMTMQQTSSSRWNPMTANLSFACIFARSRSSLGRTICPFASTETTASILQQFFLQHSLLIIVTEKMLRFQNI